jgi:hypothetical protein
MTWTVIWLWKMSRKSRLVKHSTKQAKKVVCVCVCVNERTFLGGRAVFGIHSDTI